MYLRAILLIIAVVVVAWFAGAVLRFLRMR
jgi:hypothetical protein